MALKMIKKINYKNLKEEYKINSPRLAQIDKTLKEQNSVYSPYLGWHNIAKIMTNTRIEKINKIASALSSKCSTLVVIGIGGSYLGAKAAIDFLKNKINKNEVIFTGYNMSSSDIELLLADLENKDFAINVVSKSGNTLETLVTYNILKNVLKNKFDDYKERIVITTNNLKGALFDDAQLNNYKLLNIPDNIGGRYSALTDVGLFPLAYLGYNIKKIIQGADKASIEFAKPNMENNLAYQYALIRNILYNKNFKIELFVSFEERLNYFSFWLQQLFAESEGKQGKGLFPFPVHFSRDLHSIGQLIQEGEKIFFETMIIEKKESTPVKKPFKSPYDKISNFDPKQIDYINEVIEKSTIKAHLKGGVPIIIFEIDKRDEFSLGYLIYFFQKACAISALLLGVNPFDQPGVEEYKNNMKSVFDK